MDRVSTAPAVLCSCCGRRRPGAAMRVCWTCRDRIGRHLDPANTGTPFDRDDPTATVRPASIPVLYAQLADLAPDAGERDAGEYADAAVYDLQRATIRDVRSRPDGAGVEDGPDGAPSILATLGEWAGIVRETHLDIHGHPDPLPMLVPPLRRGETPDVVAVETLCRWLYARLDWMCEQTWCVQLLADLRRLTGILRAGRGDAGGRPLGPCTAPVDADGRLVEDQGDVDDVYVCREPLFMPDRPPVDAVLPELPDLRCPSCGAWWSSQQLHDEVRERGLNATLGVGIGVAVSAVQAQRYLAIPAGTVRSWAARGRLAPVDPTAATPTYDVLQLLRLAQDAADDEHDTPEQSAS